MKDNTYQNAVEHLRFSDDLCQRVKEAAIPDRPGHRIVRSVILAAVMCMLIATTVFAAGGMIERSQQFKEVGSVVNDFSDAQTLYFMSSESTEGIQIHYMELHPKSYYALENGMLFSADDKFFRVTEDYQLEQLEYQTLEAQLEKNGRTYGINMMYVAVEGGIYSNHLDFYPVENDEILVNATARGSHSWPVYVNIQTGECRDALPEFTEKDFLPEEIEAGYDARAGFTQHFRGGILVSCIVEGMKDGVSDSTSLRYWIKDGSNEAIRLDVPKNCIDYIVNDTLYYQDRANNYYVMDENFRFHKLEQIGKTTDNLTQGLLTVRNADGTLRIVDVVSQIVYHVSGIKVGFDELWETTGYNATRHSLDGKIAVTYAFTDWETYNRPLDSIAYLDVETGELKQLKIESSYLVEAHGWLDDDRYGVIYEDGERRYLCIYEFTD